MTDIWTQVLDQLRLQVPKATFDSWLKGTRWLDDGQPLNGHMVVVTPSVYAKDWLENRLRGTIERAVKGVLGYRLEVEFRVEGTPSPALPLRGGGGKTSAPVLGGEGGRTLTPAPSPLKGEGGKTSTQTLLLGGEGGEDDVSDFDLYENDWLKHSRYDSIFRRAYMTNLARNGAVAFVTWDYLRSQHRHEAVPWTPKTEIDLHDLVEVCSPGKGRSQPGQHKSTQVMTGVNRRCPYFDGRCCGLRAGAQVDEAVGVCRYHVAGVLEMLAVERMIVCLKQGIAPYISYWVQVYRRMPLLTPHQVGSLSVELQEKHRKWLVELKIYRAWAGRKEENFLRVKQRREGLELKPEWL